MSLLDVLFARCQSSYLSQAPSSLKEHVHVYMYGHRASRVFCVYRYMYIFLAVGPRLPIVMLWLAPFLPAACLLLQPQSLLPEAFTVEAPPHSQLLQLHEIISLGLLSSYPPSHCRLSPTASALRAPLAMMEANDQLPGVSWATLGRSI